MATISYVVENNVINCVLTVLHCNSNMRKVEWMEVFSHAKQMPELFHCIMFSSYISEPIVLRKKTCFNRPVHTVFLGRPLVRREGNGSGLYRGRWNWLRFISSLILAVLSHRCVLVTGTWVSISLLATCESLNLVCSPIGF
jgi:hypothetical protein